MRLPILQKSTHVQQLRNLAAFLAMLTVHFSQIGPTESKSRITASGDKVAVFEQVADRVPFAAAVAVASGAARRSKPGENNIRGGVSQNEKLNLRLRSRK